jgi:hypothetical protein
MKYRQIVPLISLLVPSFSYSADLFTDARITQVQTLLILSESKPQLRLWTEGVPAIYELHRKGALAAVFPSLYVALRSKHASLREFAVWAPHANPIPESQRAALPLARLLDKRESVGMTSSALGNTNHPQAVSALYRLISDRRSYDREGNFLYGKSPVLALAHLAKSPHGVVSNKARMALKFASQVSSAQVRGPALLALQEAASKARHRAARVPQVKAKHTRL